jgi:hypothetical protein
MIDSIDARLIYWSEAVKGNIGTGRVSSVWGRLVSGESCAAVGRSTVQFNEVAYETEKAVQALPKSLKKIVFEYYLNESATLEQKLKTLQLSKRTLYRRLDMAHGLIKCNV